MTFLMAVLLMPTTTLCNEYQPTQLQAFLLLLFYFLTANYYLYTSFFQRYLCSSLSLPEAAAGTWIITESEEDVGGWGSVDAKGTISWMLISQTVQ